MTEMHSQHVLSHLSVPGAFYKILKIQKIALFFTFNI